MSIVKKFILRHKHISAVALYFRKLQKDIELYLMTSKKLKKCIALDEQKLFYIGIPAHTNLGDLAQGCCIRKWIKENYNDRYVVEIETNSLVNTRFPLLGKFKKVFNASKDIIVFQSGYTTTDLGGYADEMHRAVIECVPNAKILMMPQTIFFKSKENQRRTSQVYSKACNMMYLARDKVSYEVAKNMFPTLRVELFPDIVTTKIGETNFMIERKGILFCCRNDLEKYYSNEEISGLMNKCSTLDNVERTDTTKDLSAGYMVRNAERLVQAEIEKFAKYRLIITDRYHGTIFSLAAGTPVIIIKTTDHKVTTGADWFKGVYDDYVFLANDLNDAYELAKRCCGKEYNHCLKPFFKEEYYDKLKEMFEEDNGDIK